VRAPRPPDPIVGGVYKFRVYKFQARLVSGVNASGWSQIAA
jgi:hypothetical protein